MTMKYKSKSGEWLAIATFPGGYIIGWGSKDTCAEDCPLGVFVGDMEFRVASDAATPFVEHVNEHGEYVFATQASARKALAAANLALHTAELGDEGARRRVEGAERVEAVTKLEWYEAEHLVCLREANYSDVAVRCDGTVGNGAAGLTEREITEAFQIYHEHTDPKLPGNWKGWDLSFTNPDLSWPIATETVHEFEQVIAWLRWRLEQQAESDTESDGG
jgi:hypothetical protein